MTIPVLNVTCCLRNGASLVSKGMTGMGLNSTFIHFFWFDAYRQGMHLIRMAANHCVELACTGCALQYLC